MLLAQLAEQDNQTTQTIQAYQKVLLTNPDSVDAHYALGYLLQAQNQSPQAAIHFQEVIRLNPKLLEVYYNLGVFYEFHCKDTT